MVVLLVLLALAEVVAAVTLVVIIAVVVVVDVDIVVDDDDVVVASSSVKPSVTTGQAIFLKQRSPMVHMSSSKHNVDGSHIKNAVKASGPQKWVGDVWD